MRIKQQLLIVATAYATARRLSEARVSTLVFGDGGRLQRLRGGKDMLSGNVEDGLAWFSKQWPEGAVWPVDVPRPAPAPSADDPTDDAAA